MKTKLIILLTSLSFVGCGTTPPTPQEQAAIGAAEQIALSYLSAYTQKGGSQQAYVNMATGAILQAYPAVAPSQAAQIATTTIKK